MNILFVQTAFLGDVILITPLIKAAKNLFPESILDILVIPQVHEVLLHNPHINEILIFDKRNNKILNFLKTLFLLRKKHYDIALLPHSSMTTSFLIFFSHIKTRIGFDRWLSSHLLTHRIPFNEWKLRIEKNLDLLTAFSSNQNEIQTELFPNKDDIENAEKLLSELSPEKKRIAIAPGSIWNTKRWLESYYKILAQKLVDAGFSIVLIGSPEENKLCERIKPNENAINVAGKTTVLESAAILRNCDLLICNDSGALHIANAVKTDVFAFFGPTTKDIGYYPFRKNDHIFEVELSCRPCGSHGGKKCPLVHHNCMKLIKPEKVFLEVINYFKKFKNL